ncbi:MAG: Trm112 family protein [Paracoccus sp. (in: a-proteobacteria)]|nr:Trm112 family protein [Paracoccus sp. (in: a-proteobacteria)]
MTDTAPETPAGPEFDRHMLEALVCPASHGRLDYDAARQELVSRTAGLAFPIRAGIPIMLISEARQIKAD